MIASNSSKSDLPLVILATQDQARFAELQRRLMTRCAFVVCGKEHVAIRLVERELVSAWLVDANAPFASSLISQLAETRLGHRVALVASENSEESELQAYRHGAYFVVGEPDSAWLEIFLRVEDPLQVDVRQLSAEMSSPGDH